MNNSGERWKREDECSHGWEKGGGGKRGAVTILQQPWTREGKGLGGSVCVGGGISTGADSKERAVMSVEGTGSPLLSQRMQGTCYRERGGWCREELVVLSSVRAHNTPRGRKFSSTPVLPDLALNCSQDQAFPTSFSLLHPTCGSCSVFSVLVVFGLCCLIGSWTSGICALNVFKGLSPERSVLGKPSQGRMG